MTTLFTCYLLSNNKTALEIHNLAHRPQDGRLFPLYPISLHHVPKEFLWSVQWALKISERDLSRLLQHSRSPIFFDNGRGRHSHPYHISFREDWHILRRDWNF